MRRALPRDIERHPLDSVRRRCGEVASRARFVRIVPEILEAFAAALPLEEIKSCEATSFPDMGGDKEVLTGFVLVLDAVNYGSGYFPSLKKREGASGYRTIEAALREHYQSKGPLSLAELREMDAEYVARLLLQHPAEEPIAELMRLYAESWRDLGNLVARAGGSFGALVDGARGSAEALVRILLEMPLYRDIARYDGLDVPFLKRAQLSVADLAAALPQGPGRFRDMEKLTLFADNLVPHVLRVDGVLEYRDSLLERIERGELIPVGSAQEVEIRACAVHAGERLIEQLRERGAAMIAAQLDTWLWTRGGQQRYKARPRHRTRSTFY